MRGTLSLPLFAWLPDGYKKPSGLKRDEGLCDKSHTVLRCNRFVKGPAFCPSGPEGQFQVHGTNQFCDRIVQVVSFPTEAAEWCTAGASTRLSTYTPWLVKTIEYLDSDYTGRDTRVDVIDNTGPPLEELAVEVPEETNSCSTSPCGANASCWNGDGRSFLCTCDTGFPHGNPYKKCVKCVYDSHCPLNGTCVEDQCVGSSSQGPQGFLQVTRAWWFCEMSFLKGGENLV